MNIDKNDFKISKNGFQKPSEALNSTPKLMNYEPKAQELKTDQDCQEIVKSDIENDESFVVRNPMY